MMEFKKLSEVEQIESASDNATVLIEDNGEIKRVPKKEVGGAGSIATAIIKSSEYDNAIAGISTMIAVQETTYECINMTFDEAYQIIANGEPLQVHFMGSIDGIPYNACCMVYLVTTVYGVPCLEIGVYIGSLFWTANGFSTEEPYQPE